MLFFQFLLWLWLLLPALAASLFGWNEGVVAFMAFGALSLWRAFDMRPLERQSAYAFCAAFGPVSAAWLYVSKTGTSFLFALAISLTAWACLFLWFRKVRPAMDAKVLGYDGGYAIIKIEPSLVSWAQPGTYAVGAKPVKKGKKVKVRFDLVSRKGRIV